MHTLHANISASFGHDKRPPLTDLVLLDGFDQYEKEYAVAFYGGKTWQDVHAYLQGLKNNVAAGAAYQLEEWSVLNPAYLAYYLRAHFEYLFETLNTEDPDTAFILYLLRELQQVIHAQKDNPFTPAQTALIKQVAQFIRDHAAKHDLYAYEEQDLEQYTAKLLVDLEAYGS